MQGSSSFQSGTSEGTGTFVVLFVEADLAGNLRMEVSWPLFLEGAIAGDGDLVNFSAGVGVTSSPQPSKGSGSSLSGTNKATEVLVFVATIEELRSADLEGDLWAELSLPFFLEVGIAGDGDLVRFGAVSADLLVETGGIVTVVKLSKSSSSV